MEKATKALRGNIPEIMGLWKNAVTKESQAGKVADGIALYDHLPDLILHITNIMERHDRIGDINIDQMYIIILDACGHQGSLRANTAEFK